MGHSIEDFNTMVGQTSYLNMYTNVLFSLPQINNLLCFSDRSSHEDEDSIFTTKSSIKSPPKPIEFSSPKIETNKAPVYAENTSNNETSNGNGDVDFSSPLHSSYDGSLSGKEISSYSLEGDNNVSSEEPLRLYISGESDSDNECDSDIEQNVSKDVGQKFSIDESDVSATKAISPHNLSIPSNESDSDGSIVC